MEKISIIHWVNRRYIRPTKTGWYMGVLLPENYMDLQDNVEIVNDWIEKYGIDKIWWDNSSFWKNGKDIYLRVLYWAKIPSVPVIEN